MIALGHSVVFLIVAVVLFILAAIPPLRAWWAVLVAAGLAFVVLAFLVPKL